MHAPFLKSAVDIADRHSRILASALDDLDLGPAPTAEILILRTALD